MTLSEAREAIAEALSTVDGYTVRARPFTAPPKTGDGWIVVQGMQPSTESFAGYMVRMVAVLVMSTSDEAAAELHFEEDAVDLFTAITEAEDIFPADLSIDAQVLVTGTNQAPLYVAALALTLEVD